MMHKKALTAGSLDRFKDILDKDKRLWDLPDKMVCRPGIPDYWQRNVSHYPIFPMNGEEIDGHKSLR